MSSTIDSADVALPIVVGIDGSAQSRIALAWAAKQAALTSSPLNIIMTWEYPTNYGYTMGWPEDIDFAADAKSELEKCVSEVLGTDPKIEVTASVHQGHAALMLVEESKHSSLLVVGSRGHGEFAGMLLGSVSEFAATHADCPVVIIRDSGDTSTHA
jgi:nucleotide-binding universal stress UspA family protein